MAKTKKRKPTHAERAALIKALLAHAIAQHAMLQNPGNQSDDPNAGMMPPPGAGGPPPPMPMVAMGPPGGASGAFPFGQPPAGR